MKLILTDPRFSAHVAIFAGALFAFYKFGDRSEMTQKALEGTAETMNLIRASITSSLLAAIKVSSDASKTTALVVVPGQSYTTYPANFLESENLRSSISEFIKNQTGPLADFKTLDGSVAGWLRATRIRSWTLLILVFAELASIFAMFVIDGILRLEFVRSYYNHMIGVSVVLVVFALLTFPIILYRHDRIIELCQRYNPH